MSTDPMYLAISEYQLRDYGRHKQIAAARIVRVRGGYRLIVTVAFSKSEMLLYTTRNKPREFASLDRLIQKLTAEVAGLKVVTLEL